MVVITNTQGQVIHRSRNLRGIVDHARRVGLDSACADPSMGRQGYVGRHVRRRDYQSGRIRQLHGAVQLAARATGLERYTLYRR